MAEPTGAKEWVSCEICSGEWREEEGYDTCPYCEKAAQRSRYEAVEEWKREQMKDAQREDLGPDPREYAYWEKLM